MSAKNRLLPTTMSSAGFTLLELLMVVIIIAILASVALPQYFRVTERSRTGQVLEFLASVRGSELRFKAQDASNLYTTNTNSLDLGINSGTFGYPAGWNGLAASGTGAGADVFVTRNGGTYSGAGLRMDLDTGNICGNNASAANDWGLRNGADC